MVQAVDLAILQRRAGLAGVVISCLARWAPWLHSPTSAGEFGLTCKSEPQVALVMLRMACARVTTFLQAAGCVWSQFPAHSCIRTSHWSLVSSKQHKNVLERRRERIKKIPLYDYEDSLNCNFYYCPLMLGGFLGGCFLVLFCFGGILVVVCFFMNWHD